MRVTIIGSGSRGNATLFESGTTRVLVDAGLSARRVRTTLFEEIGVDARSLEAIVLTHAHGDHVAHTARLARTFDARVYLTPETRARIELPPTVRAHEFARSSRFRIGALQFRACPVPHDAPQVGLVVSDKRDCAAIVTDLGRVPRSLPRALAKVRTLLLESNHDRELLAMAPYPGFVRERIASPTGHLANDQSAALLRELRDGPLERVVLMHLSQKANSEAKARRIAREALGPDIELLVAEQDRPMVLEGNDPTQLALGL